MSKFIKIRMAGWQLLPSSHTFFVIREPFKRKVYYKYLGIFVDVHLRWKGQIVHISKKTKRSVGLTSLGNTYESNLKSIYILQKKVLRLMSFFAFDHPSSPLFTCLIILKFSDIVTFQNAVLMYKFHNNMLPHAFKSFFNKVDQVHKYNTRLAAKQSYYIPKVRTNYGIFNLIT